MNKCRDNYKEGVETARPSKSSIVRMMAKNFRDKIVRRNKGRYLNLVTNHITRTITMRVGSSGNRMATVMELNLLSLKLARLIPPDSFDIVVGVPRMGIVMASIIALCHGTAMTTPELLCEGKVWRMGKKYDRPYKRVLVVDDSIGEGTHIKAAIEMIKKYNNVLDIKTAR